MHIGIDARMYGSPAGGIGRYVRQLVLHLLMADTTTKYTLLVKTDRLEDVQKDVGQYLDRVTIVSTDIGWYTLREQLVLPRVLGRLNVDLFHFPHWNVPVLYRKPFVVTIHDLIMYHYPRPEATTLGPLLFWVKDRVHRFVLKRAGKTAQHILTTSVFTKNDIHDTLGTPLEKMTVTYQAPFEKALALEQDDFDMKDAGITKPYILYVGSAYPHKNLERLLSAWEVFEEKIGDEYQLVLVGKKDAFYDRLFEKVGKPASVVHLGYVSDSALEKIYQGASLYVFPSLYEGFGLPPLEALLHNIPVAASSSTCLPEVLGDAALYFDPANVSGMAQMMILGVTEPEIRYTMRENAKDLLQKYSWGTLAAQTSFIYHDVV